LLAWHIRKRGLSIAIASGKLSWSIRWWETTNTINSFPTTGQIKINSTFDNSGFFVAGQRIILFTKRWNGLEFDPREDATLNLLFQPDLILNKTLLILNCKFEYF